MIANRQMHVVGNKRRLQQNRVREAKGGSPTFDDRLCRFRKEHSPASPRRQHDVMPKHCERMIRSYKGSVGLVRGSGMVENGRQHAVVVSVMRSLPGKVGIDRD